MSEISTTLMLNEVEDHDPDIYWAILDQLEEDCIDHDAIGEVEIVEMLGLVEVTVRDEEGDEVFILEIDPTDFSER